MKKNLTTDDSSILFSILYNSFIDHSLNLELKVSNFIYMLADRHMHIFKSKTIDYSLIQKIQDILASAQDLVKNKIIRSKEFNTWFTVSNIIRPKIDIIKLHLDKLKKKQSKDHILKYYYNNYLEKIEYAILPLSSMIKKVNELTLRSSLLIEDIKLLHSSIIEALYKSISSTYDELAKEAHSKNTKLIDLLSSANQELNELKDNSEKEILIEFDSMVKIFDNLSVIISLSCSMLFNSFINDYSLEDTFKNRIDQLKKNIERLNNPNLKDEIEKENDSNTIIKEKSSIVEFYSLFCLSFYQLKIIINQVTINDGTEVYADILNILNSLSKHQVCKGDPCESLIINDYKDIISTVFSSLEKLNDSECAKEQNIIKIIECYEYISSIQNNIQEHYSVKNKSNLILFNFIKHLNSLQDSLKLMIINSETYKTSITKIIKDMFTGIKSNKDQFNFDETFFEYLLTNQIIEKDLIIEIAKYFINNTIHNDLKKLTTKLFNELITNKISEENSQTLPISTKSDSIKSDLGKLNESAILDLETEELENNNAKELLTADTETALSTVQIKELSIVDANITTNTPISNILNLFKNSGINIVKISFIPNKEKKNLKFICTTFQEEMVINLLNDLGINIDEISFIPNKEGGNLKFICTISKEQSNSNNAISKYLCPKTLDQNNKNEKSRIKDMDLSSDENIEGDKKKDVSSGFINLEHDSKNVSLFCVDREDDSQLNFLNQKSTDNDSSITRNIDNDKVEHLSLSYVNQEDDSMLQIGTVFYLKI